MNQKQDLVSNVHSRYPYKRLAAALVFLYLGFMIFMFLVDLKTVFEPSLLLPIMNTIFAGLIPVAVSIIAARAYLFSGLNSLLFMGCGMMTFGCAAILAGWLISGQQGPNVNVTIYNTGALLGSVFHIFGTVFTFKNVIPDVMPELRKIKLIMAYTGMILIMFFLTLATFWGMTPPFFIQGVGPTLLRQAVLGTAVFLFLLSALIIMKSFTKRQLDFYYWYSLSLIMIALGLIAFFIQKSVGNPIGWLGRSGQYIGGIYALIAILITFKTARIKGVSMSTTVAGLFSDAELSYRVLVDTITDAVVYFGQDGKIIQWNTAAEKVFGYRQNEAVGSSIFKLVIGEAFLEMFRKEINNLSAIDDRRKVGRLLDISVKTKEKGVIPVEISISAMKVKDEWSFICVVRDITERKNAEAAIQKLNENLEQRVEERTRQLTTSEQRLSLATIAGKIGIWDWNVENDELIWDNSMYSLYGIRKEDFGGAYDAWSRTLHPDDRQFAEGEIQAALRGEREYASEFRIVQPDGTIRIIKAVSQTIRDRDGKPLRMIGTNIDITDRKRAEEEKLKLKNQLFQSQKMEAIGTLAGGIAHDFNNILSVIIGYTELAMDKDQKENKKQYLQETLKGAERAKSLVKQILTFSRQVGHEKKPLDIKILLKEAVKFLRASIPTTVEISQHITEEDCNIMADPTQMHQVIMNLCTNASHAMKQAGGILKIELANIELIQGDLPSHPELKPGHYVNLTVGDTGHGIDPALIQRIFDPFFTTKSVDEGTGLGLSVVYGIVKNHGGVITVYSEQGKGATFNIYLPRIIQTEAMGMDADKPVIGGTERILFVDDELSLVDIGMRILFPLGYYATGATSTKEALDIFRADPQRFDLVITDMTLPKMTGIDLSRKLLQIRPDIPIILCSGIREPDTEEQARSLGIRTYLTKPLTRRELSHAIRNTLDGNSKSLDKNR